MPVCSGVCECATPRLVARALDVVFASTAIGAVLGGLQVSAIATPTK
jgi:hypothetical protein